MAHEFNQETAFEPQTEKYRLIDQANAESFLMVEGANLQVIGSIESVGAPREMLTPGYEDKYDADVIAEAKLIGRRMLAGNMSPKGSPEVYGPDWMSNEERIADADRNIHNFFEQHAINPENVRMLRPERDYTTPLGIVNLDEEQIGVDEIGIPTPDKAGDFMYTRNPNIALAARPADCPIAFVSAETQSGPVNVLLHLATLGVAHDYIEQAKVALDGLGVDWNTVRVQITPGAHADTYSFTNSPSNPREQFPDHKDMYVDFKPSTDDDGSELFNDKEQALYDYEIELAAYVYENLIATWGLDPYQVFADTTNTPSHTSGTSSHSRTRKKYAVNGHNSRAVYVGVPLKTN